MGFEAKSHFRSDHMDYMKSGGIVGFKLHFGVVFTSILFQCMQYEIRSTIQEETGYSVLRTPYSVAIKRELHVLFLYRGLERSQNKPSPSLATLASSRSAGRARDPIQYAPGVQSVMYSVRSIEYLKFFILIPRLLPVSLVYNYKYNYKQYAVT
jgi:hypothetical protein